MLLRRLYYWKGMKKQIFDYVKNCRRCQEFNRHAVKYTPGHFAVPEAPMEFISMDLIGEFTKSSKGNKYALTIICMLTGYTFCIPIPNKTAGEVVKAYIDNVYCKFGGSKKILSDNGTEFKNELFTTVANELGVEFKIYSPPYRPQSNGRIEGFHYFLKACMGKYITPKLDWDDVVPLACAAYNFLPNEHSKESPFFLMFGREPRLPLQQMLSPKIRYMGNEECLINLESMKNIYAIAAYNLKRARERAGKIKFPTEHKIKHGDTVLIKNHTASAFEPKYKGDFKVVSIRGNQVELMPAEGGKTFQVHITDCKNVLPADNVIAKIPNYNNFGRKTNLAIKHDKIPDLNWSLTTQTSTINTSTYSHQTSGVETTKQITKPIVCIST
jgi:transposase InsO family protein